MRIAICDDEIRQIVRIKEYLRDSVNFNEKTHLCEFESGEDLLRKYEEGEKFDIVFLDIRMQGINGLNTAERIRRQDQKVIIIFITSLLEYAVKSYSVRAFNYLIKPIVKPKLIEVFDRAVREIEFDRENKIQFKIGKNNFLNINVCKVYFIESKLRKLVVYFGNENAEYYETLAEEEKRLRSHGFVRIHRSYLVNLMHVERIGESGIVMSNGKELAVGENYREDFLRKYMDYYRD